MKNDKIGLIAGRGKLPKIWMEKALKNDKQIFVFSLTGEDNDSYLKNKAEIFQSVNIGKLGKLINLIQKYSINQVIFLGKIEKKDVFEKFTPDNEMKKIIARLDQISNEHFLKAIAQYFEEKGITVLKQSTFLEQMLAGSGVLTSDSPSEELLANMKYGLDMARGIYQLNIGQTVIVKDRMVLAVEALEGTDEVIKRGSRLGKKGIIMAKASSPQQDFRFDLPTVGMTTINLLAEVEAQALVFDADKTFILEKDKFLKTAEKANITVMGIAGNN